MKKLRLLCITAALTSTLFSSTVFASAVQATGNSLDVDAAINKAIENSYSIKKIDIGIQQAQNSYNDATRSAANYNKMLLFVKDDNKRLELVKGRDFPQLECKYGIFQYTNVKEVAKNQVKLGVYQLYSGLMSLKDGIDVQTQNVNNVEQQYKKAQLQLSLGNVSPVEVKKSEATLNAEKAKLNGLQRQYDGLTKQLNQLLGVDVNTKYTSFTKDNLADTPFPKTYNEYLVTALTNRTEIRNDNENINLKKSEFETVRGIFPYSTSAQNKIAKFPIEEAKNKLERDRIDISIEINTLYNDLQNKMKKLEPAQKKYDAAKQTYDKALQTYNVGMLSKIDFDRAQIGFRAEEIAVKSIKRDIWLAQTKLLYASNEGVDASRLASQGDKK